MERSSSKIYYAIWAALVLTMALLFSCTSKPDYQECGKPVVCTLTDVDGRIISIDTVPCLIVIGNDTLSMEVRLR